MTGELKITSNPESKVNGYTEYRIKIDEDDYVTFFIGGVFGCCGSMNIASMEEHYLDNDDERNDAIFEELKRIAVQDFSVRNIVYFDVSKYQDNDDDEGHINHFLSKHFEKLTEYRNPNSGNIVEIRSYTLTVEEYNANLKRFQSRVSDDFDENAWYVEDEDD